MAKTPIQIQIDSMVAAVIKRANQLAPNSNFYIHGIEAGKFCNVAQAIIEAMIASRDEMEWATALKISERPRVDEALRAFLDDATEDGAVAVVLAIAKELSNDI